MSPAMLENSLPQIGHTICVLAECSVLSKVVPWGNSHLRLLPELRICETLTLQLVLNLGK